MKTTASASAAASATTNTPAARTVASTFSPAADHFPAGRRGLAVLAWLLALVIPAAAAPLVELKKTSIVTVSNQRFLTAEYKREVATAILFQLSDDLVTWEGAGMGNAASVTHTVSTTDPLLSTVRVNQPVTSAPRYFLRAMGRRARMDHDRSGTTDLVVVRNVGGGSNGAVRWFINHNNGSTSTVDFGISSDSFTPGDFNGDGFADPAIFKGSGQFQILQSLGGGLRTVNLGQTGDRPVCADYDGDGKTDPAVFRSSTTGNQFLYIGSLNNPTSAVTTVSLGTTSGFPNPGDFDGDGKTDFCVQVNGGGGNGRYLILRSSDGVTESFNFGTPTDTVTSGDYDGDGRDDIVAIRGVSGVLNWNILLRRPGGGTVQVPHGASATEEPVPGDYDGDGKLDIAVWAAGASGGTGTFKILRSTTGSLSNVSWGQLGDFAVARSFVR